MLKAGSLYYAIIICVLVGICCMALLLLSHYSDVHHSLLASHTRLVNNNESSVSYFSRNLDMLEGSNKKISVFNDDITTSADVKKWGFYRILNISSVLKNDTIRTSTFLAPVNKETIALYLPDKQEPFYIVGNPKIYGDVFIPKKGIKKGYITNTTFKGGEFLQGKVHNSRKKLPSLKFSFKQGNKDFIRVLSDEVEENKLFFNSFDKKTISIKVNRSLLHDKILSGNIVLEHKDSLYIRNSNKLNNVIIKAPIVVFEKKFKGVVQVDATEKIIIEEGAELQFPSSVHMKNDSVVKMELTLQSKSKFCGSIVVTGNSFLGSNRLITIDNESEVYGNVYCLGATQLKGKLYGTLYTDHFYLKTDASVYENYIKNGVIDRRKLPDIFLGVSFNGNTENSISYGVVKTL